MTRTAGRSVFSSSAPHEHQAANGRTIAALDFTSFSDRCWGISSGGIAAGVMDISACDLLSIQVDAAGSLDQFLPQTWNSFDVGYGPR